MVCLDLLQGAAPDERGTEATSMMDGKIFLAPLPVRAATVGLGFCPPTGGGSVWPCERGGEKMPPARRNIVFWIFGGGFIGSLIDRKSTRLNSSHLGISYAVFCLKKK